MNKFINKSNNNKLNVNRLKNNTVFKKFEASQIKINKTVKSQKIQKIKQLDYNRNIELSERQIIVSIEEIKRLMGA